MIKIEKQYRLLRKDVVAEYRRIITPFFFFRLKTKIYTKKEYKRTCMWHVYSTFKWTDEKENLVYGDVRKMLEIENKNTGNKALFFSA